MKAEHKTLSAPSGKLETSLVSINQMLKKSKEVQSDLVQDYSQRPSTPFNIDELKMVWKQFAFKMKDNGIETIYLAMSKRDPKILNQFEIHQEFDNQIQIAYMEKHFTDLLDFVRQKLNNWSIQIFFTVSEHQDENKKLLTGKDRFDEMAKKNSNLYSLQKTFNLDIDY